MGMVGHPPRAKFLRKIDLGQRKRMTSAARQPVLMHAYLNLEPAGLFSLWEPN